MALKLVLITELGKGGMIGRMIKSQPDSSPLGSSETELDFIGEGRKGNTFCRSSFPVSDKITLLEG